MRPCQVPNRRAGAIGRGLACASAASGALIITSAENMAPRKAAAGDSQVIDLAKVRPTRARIRPDA